MPADVPAVLSPEELARIGEGTTHTRTDREVGPDYCDECSNSANQWVVWPCPTVAGVLSLDALLQRLATVRGVLEMGLPPGGLRGSYLREQRALRAAVYYARKALTHVA